MSHTHFLKKMMRALFHVKESSKGVCVLALVGLLLPTMIWGSVALQDDKTRKNQTTKQQDNKTTKQQDNKTTRQQDDKTTKKQVKQPVSQADEEIPDSLLHPRWKIQRTTPITYDDFKSGTADLDAPENVEQKAEYNDTLDSYMIGSKMGNTWLAAPVIMSIPEYLKWSEKVNRNNFFRSKNAEVFETKGNEKFDFSYMHFDMGPAEKI